MAPVADDPYIFGQIAAANSLSDVYAMGGEPIAALGVLGFPVDEVPADTIRQMLAGAWDKVREAGAVVAGGHTMKERCIRKGWLPMPGFSRVMFWFLPNRWGPG